MNARQPVPTQADAGGGVLVLRRDGSLVHRDTFADRLLAVGRPLQLDADRVEANGHGPLEALLEAFRCNRLTDEHSFLHRCSQLGLLALRARPLVPADADQRRQRAWLAIAIITLDQPPAVDPERVRELFELTRAEARVAAGIAAGLAVSEVAESSGHQVSTTRTLLKRIYAKTGTHRQNELAVLILRAAANTL